MEIPAESEFIEVKSPIDRFKEQWEAQPGSLNFFRQLNVINKNPQSLQYAALSSLKGWTQPLVFAIQGLLLAAFLLSVTNWLITKDRGKQADQIASQQNDWEAEKKRQQGVLDATQEAIDQINRSVRKTTFTVAGSPVPLSRDQALQQLNALLEETKKLEQKYKNRIEARQHELRAAEDALALGNSGTPLVFSLALLFAAQVVRRGIQRDYGRFKLARQADSFYLYFAVSQGIWINCGLVFVMHLWFSAASYGLSGSSEAIGPILSILFWVAVLGLLIYYFSVVSKDLYQAMQIPVPSNFYSLENRILVRLHQSFWLVFLVFEAGLIALSYGSYLLERHAG